MITLSSLLAMAAFAAAPPAVGGDASPRGFLLGEAGVGAAALPYALYVPRDYDPARRWPLVLFLHGAGESGRDGVRPLTQGLAPALASAPGDWPALVLFPQKPDENLEWERFEATLLALVDSVRASHAVDPARIYLTGLSQGGHGTWVLGARHPRLWAALAPVCGYATARRHGQPGGALPLPFTGSAEELAPALAALPVWAFHGEEDPVVPVAETRSLVAAIAARGGRPRATYYPGVGHGAWDPAYRSSELAAWLFAQRRATPATP